MTFEKSALTSDQVCAIIKASGEAGVKVLKFDGLYLDFGKPPTHVAMPPSQPSPWDISMGYPAPLPPVPTMTESDHSHQNELSLAQAEVRTRERQVEDLLITDPLLAEQLIAEGELK